MQLTVIKRLNHQRASQRVRPRGREVRSRFNRLGNSFLRVSGVVELSDSTVTTNMRTQAIVSLLKNRIHPSGSPSWGLPVSRANANLGTERRDFLGNEGSLRAPYSHEIVRATNLDV